MKMMKRRSVAQAAALVAGMLAVTLNAFACQAPSSKPMNTGPLDAQGMFSQWVVDRNGVGLQICTDSLTADGNPPPCFYDPIVPGNALSVAQGRGGEAFWYLADSAFTTTGAAPIDAVIVMAVESAYLADEPTAGFQTQFQRLRTRMNVAATGIYTVETPWSKKEYRVETLLPAGNGQNRSEISEPIDITFEPNSTVPGLVAPFLIATPAPAGYAGYIGDGLTPTRVTGSPCGDNFIRITAVGLDGVTPININNGSNVYTNEFFTVMGKLAPTTETPLAITSAYYSRVDGVDSITVMAEGTFTETQTADVTLGAAAPVRMTKDQNRYFITLPSTGPLPAQVSVVANDTGRPSTANTETAALRDLVTISTAQANCSGVGATRACTLQVVASSSDDGSIGGAPVLTLALDGSELTGGSTTLTTKALPPSVTVTSSRGGVASRPVTLIQQP